MPPTETKKTVLDKLQEGVNQARETAERLKAEQVITAPTVETEEVIPAPTAANGFNSGVSAKELRDEMFRESQTQEDPADIRKTATERFQSEIDTVDDLYENLIEDARIEGAKRLESSLGQTRSVQANRGILGSNRGFAQKTKVTEQEEARTNRNITTLEKERAVASSKIQAQANSLADTRIAAAEKAKSEGTESYIKFLEGEEERNQYIAGQMIDSFIQQGLPLDEMEESEVSQLAGSLGVSVPQLEQIYTGKLAEAQKDTENDVDILLDTLAKKGAPARILKEVAAAKTSREAMMIASPYLKDELAALKLESERALINQRNRSNQGGNENETLSSKELADLQNELGWEVRPGDTMSDVAKRNDVSEEDLSSELTAAETTSSTSGNQSLISQIISIFKGGSKNEELTEEEFLNDLLSE